MAADDKFGYTKSYKSVADYGQQEVTEGNKPSGEFWIRIYNKKGAKLPYDLCLDTMPMLKGMSEFACKNNKFAAKLLSQLRDNLKPGAETDLENLTLRVYRKAEAQVSNDDDDDDEYYI